MIRTITLSLLLIAISTTVFSDSSAQICVSREENNGVLNIRPVEITANDKHILWISGGESKCVEVAPGQYSIIAKSPDPYDPYDKNPATWKSKELLLSVQAGSRLEINVFPVSQGASWELKQ